VTSTAESRVTAEAVAVLRRPRRLRLLWLAALVVVLVVLCAASVAIGSRDVGLDDIVAALAGSSDGYDRAAVAKRIPRTLLAAVAGAALAVSGLAMQAVTRNPVAEPGILGINHGAALAVVVGIAWFGLEAAISYIWVAILGAALTAAFVYAVGSLGRGGATPLKLALAGAATTAALSSFVTAIVLPRPDISESVVSWEIGGVGGATTDSLLRLLPFLVAGLVGCLLLARGMNMLGLGDELATGLGERVAVTRVLAWLAAVVLCGATTAVTGPIVFVGLMVPHVCRLLVGVDHRWLVPFAALAGASLLIAADVVGRVINPPSEVDVGIITALLGAPVFIAIVRQRRVREL
jgi:iron complex transport system permease protein